LSEAAIAGKRLQLMHDRAEQTIEAQVRNALQALETARQRMRAASAGAIAAKDKLDSETRLFASGESTNFLVLTRQNEYSEARRLVVDAETAFNKAVAQYEAALGTTLSARRIAIE
jgi:HAE1 family hydrophobic/amphiphilic exporter-1